MWLVPFVCAADYRAAMGVLAGSAGFADFAATFHISPLDIGFTPCMVTVHLIRQAFGVAAGIDVIGTLEWVDIVVVVE